MEAKHSGWDGEHQREKSEQLTAANSACARLSSLRSSARVHFFASSRRSCKMLSEGWRGHLKASHAMLDCQLREKTFRTWATLMTQARRPC